MVKVISARDNFCAEDGVLAAGTDWSVTKKTLVGGLQQGVEILQVDNGKMQFDVILTRGMSVGSITCGQIRLGWDSPVQQIVHPMFVNQQDDGGLGWLSGFNECMVRCGVSFAGQPGEDAGIPLTLHGRIANTPASEVEVIVEEQSQPRIRIRGLVSERVFKFGSFDLWTEVSTVVGSRQVGFHDLVNSLAIRTSRTGLMKISVDFATVHLRRASKGIPNRIMDHANVVHVHQEDQENDTGADEHPDQHPADHADSTESDLGLFLVVL